MAASTITRTGVTLTNDTGTASSPAGDGTLINNAWVQTFMDRIDALFSGTLTVGNLIKAEGFGDHTFSASGSGYQILTLRNTAAGTGNYTAYLVGNDVTAYRSQIRLQSSNYTTLSNSFYVPDGMSIECSGAGGITLGAINSLSPIRFYTGGYAERARFATTGHFIMPELGANPGLTDCATLSAVSMYMKADKLVFAYNNNGTMTYVTIALDGTCNSITHGTSAP